MKFRAMMWAALCVIMGVPLSGAMDVRLTTGGILRNAVVNKWEHDVLVIKHAGGVARVRKSQIVAQDLRVLEAMKAEAERPRTFGGQVFVMTQGAGAYKFAGAEVFAYMANNIDLVRQEFARSRDWDRASANAKLVGSTRADADGNYALELPGEGSYFIFCQVTRFVRQTETYTWIVPVREERLDLSNANMWPK